MDITSDSFWQSILNLDATLVSKIVQGEKIVDISDDHKSKIKSLLLKSAGSNEWDKISEHIAYWIYAGSVQNFLLHQTVNNSLNPLIAKHNADEIKRIANARKGGKADKKVKPSKEQLLKFEMDYSTEYLRKNGVKTSRGWKKEACKSFKITLNTLNTILD